MGGMMQQQVPMVPISPNALPQIQAALQPQMMQQPMMQPQMMQPQMMQQPMMQQPMMQQPMMQQPMMQSQMPIDWSQWHLPSQQYTPPAQYSSMYQAQQPMDVTHLRPAKLKVVNYPPQPMRTN